MYLPIRPRGNQKPALSRSRSRSLDVDNHSIILVLVGLVPGQGPDLDPTEGYLLCPELGLERGVGHVDELLAEGRHARRGVGGGHLDGAECAIGRGIDVHAPRRGRVGQRGGRGC